MIVSNVNLSFGDRIVNDVVVVMIEVFGKNLNYEGDSTQKFIYVFSIYFIKF